MAIATGWQRPKTHAPPRQSCPQRPQCAALDATSTPSQDTADPAPPSASSAALKEGAFDPDSPEPSDEMSTHDTSAHADANADAVPRRHHDIRYIVATVGKLARRTPRADSPCFGKNPLERH